MLQTFKEGLYTLQRVAGKRLKRIQKTITGWKKTHLQRVMVLSMAAKLVVATLPLTALPALAQTVVIPSVTTEISFDAQKMVQVPEQMVITMTPGDSNTTTLVNQKQQKVVATAVAQSHAVVASQPSLDELRALYHEAGDQYNVPWEVLEAVHQVESGKSGNTTKRSMAGAMGPMQFMPSTWRAYAVDAGDGGSITSVRDSVYTAAHYISANMQDHGGSVKAALYQYNHSQRYVSSVLGIARELGADL